MIYFLKGRLPWQGLKVYGKEDKYEKILSKKRNTPLQILCEGLPNEFVEYLQSVRNLEYTQDPDYKYLKGLLEKIMKDKNYIRDNIFDWTVGISSEDKDGKDGLKLSNEEDKVDNTSKKAQRNQNSEKDKKL
jgi:hypothetical protein